MFFFFLLNELFQFEKRVGKLNEDFFYKRFKLSFNFGGKLSNKNQYFLSHENSKLIKFSILNFIRQIKGIRDLL